MISISSITLAHLYVVVHLGSQSRLVEIAGGEKITAKSLDNYRTRFSKSHFIEGSELC